MLLREIEKFLARTGMPATKFGRLAVSDPRLVLDMRNGREPRRRMILRVEHFMNKYTETLTKRPQESLDVR
ncbi:hypothetical protein [Croceicoccus naphthovorans]|uniref:Uncharacterized protein n=1 Tax=Croceicoccus naphthovorans TaxID=1348774 RepID=A0A0G3XM45_9SPHN|nr:hypothetical protein [Croceicoccus naphthovorans]AKM11701.1 hypothetical protein AB433_09310 [Croceicoccus naphthovorans]MBB3991584.1 2,4-dienoyl-CoA reductase-like NADH-dependent reductase (Old Yellow Enzyme family) [Croceicoccus naphthovorans]